MNNGMKKCVKCGREIPAGYGFCKYCGAKQPSNSKASVNSTVSTANNNNYNYKIVDKNSNNNSYNADEAINEANQRASIANQRAKKAENEVRDANKEKQALKRARVAERKASKMMNAKSLKLRRRTQKVQQQASDAQRKQEIKERKLQKQTSPKYIKKHRLHLLILTYLMPIIAFFIFAVIGGYMNASTGNMIACIGTGVVSIIAVVMAWSMKNWYKKSSIISMVWNVL